MSRKLESRLAFLAALLVAALACPNGTLQAKTLFVYDLDSLVFMSTEVAEVEIIRTQEATKLGLIDVKVMLVHKGGFKKEQTVAVAHTRSYSKPAKKEVWDSQMLAVGDRLVIFCKRAEPTDQFRIPEGAVIYAPLPGGMRLIQGDQVISFFQNDNPGPYVANYPFELTVESFREKVRKSLRDTEEWARLVEAKQDKLNVPRLLKLLGDRSQQTHGGRDYFTERICERFAESHAPDLLSRALPLVKDYHEVWILQKGFGTPQGRDYLLAKVMDVKEPMPARLRYAYSLHNAGEVFRSTLTPNRDPGEADEGNAGYLTRIAKAAHATVKHEDLCGSLVRCIDWYGQGIVQNKPAPLMADLLGAYAVLKEIYDAKPSEEIQFAIEKATAWDQNAYEKLKSPCGTFISILRAVDPAMYTKPEKRSLLFAYDYSTMRLNWKAELRPSVVLVHQETQKKVVIPWQVQITGSNLQIHGWSTGGGSGSVELPKDLPTGRYRVFFQVIDGDKVISTGHYFVADL